MNNLKDIHNLFTHALLAFCVVLSGFQWTIWRIYTTLPVNLHLLLGCFIRISMNNLKDIHNAQRAQQKHDELFYQDFNEQFEGYTQRKYFARPSTTSCFIRISMNNLKDIHNCGKCYHCKITLFYQDFNEQFEGYTQLWSLVPKFCKGCFIRISMNNLSAKVQKK